MINSKKISAILKRRNYYKNARVKINNVVKDQSKMRKNIINDNVLYYIFIYYFTLIYMLFNTWRTLCISDISVNGIIR